MSIFSGLTLSDDGVVTGEWNEYSSSMLLRSIRKADPESVLFSVFVLARLAHEVLSEHSGYSSAPVFSTGNSSSLFAAMLKEVSLTDWDAIQDASDDDVIAAVNIARWLLRLPQQTSAPLVFVGGPSGSVPSPRGRSRSTAAAS